MTKTSPCLAASIQHFTDKPEVSETFRSCLGLLRMLGFSMQPIDAPLSGQDKQHACAFVIHYTRNALEDHHLSVQEQQNIAALKSIFRIEEGDLLEMGRDDIRECLAREAESIFADDRVDDSELMHQAEVQRAFDLGFDQHLELIRTVSRPLIDSILENARGKGEAAKRDAIRRLQSLQTVVRIDTERMVALWPDEQ